jgi:hypothetical protein
MSTPRAELDQEVVPRFVRGCEVAQACTTCVPFALVAIMCTLACTVITEITAAHMAG